MKKWLSGLLLVVALLAMTGCGGTQLQINNQSTLYFQEVTWLDTYFGDMFPGDSVTRSVSSGSDSIYIKINGYWYFTVDVIYVYAGEKSTYTLYDETLVYDAGSLGAKAAGKAIRLGDLK